MLNFISFGSGSSGNSYYLYTESDGLLIDAGIGLRALKKFTREYGVSFSNARAIIVTHDHADHIKAVGVLSNELNLPVYATAGVHHGIDRNYCVQKKVPAANVRCIVQGEPFCVGCFSITPFDVPHDSTGNVGYRIEVDGGVFCIITDAGCVTSAMRQQIAEANYLVLEANYDETMLAKGHYSPYLKQRIASERGHLSNAACAAALAENMGDGLRNVWLCHLSEENNHPELARKTVESVLAGRLRTSGGDIQLEVLKRKVPSGIYQLAAKETEAYVTI